MKKLFLVLFLSFLFIGGVSAYSKTYDPLKNEILVKDTGGSQAIKMTLIKNTYICGYQCEAIIKIDVLKSGLSNPFNDFKIKKKINSNWQLSSLKSFNLYQNKTGSWNKLTKTQLNTGISTPGTYYLKLVGTKNPEETYDWIPSMFGGSLEINEWAVWGATQVYDENNDGSMNTSLWSNASTTGSYAETDEGITQSGFLTAKAYTHSPYAGGGTRKAYIRTTNLPNYPDLDNVTLRANMSILICTGIDAKTCAVQLSIFGTIVKSYSISTFSGTYNDDSIWTAIKRHDLGDNIFDIYDDGVYDQQITATDNEIYGYALADTSLERTIDSRVSIDYLYYEYGNSTMNITLNSPQNNKEILVEDNVLFNITTNLTLNQLSNISLYLNGVLNETKTWTGTLNTTTFTKESNLDWNNWSVKVCDDAGNCKFSEVRNINSRHVLYNSQNYSSSTTETSNESFSANISYGSSKWITISGKLNYNGTEYSSTYSGSGDNLSFSSNVTIPSVSAITLFPFYWNITLTNASGSYSFTSSQINQTVKPLSTITITSSSCGGGTFEAINYTFEDEVNFTNLSVDVSYNFKYGIGNLSSKETYGYLNNTQVLRVCINSTINNYKLGYGEIDYTPSGYSERRYYMFNGHSLSNSSTESFTLYSLKNTDSNSFIFEAKDTTLNPYTNNYLSLFRWYPSLNEYKVVEMASTDENGKSVMKVKVEDVDYKVGLYEKDGTLIKLAEAVRMACLVNPCTYTLSVNPSSDDYFEVLDVVSSLVYDETNKRFVFTWSDSNQNTHSMRLEVYKDAGSQQILICNSTSSGYTGVLTCGIGNYTGTFYAKAFRTASPEKLYSWLTWTIRTGIESTFGLFLAGIIALAAGLIGIFSPIGGIVMVSVGMILPLAVGSINLAIFMGILTLGGIVIHFLRKTNPE